MIINVRLPDGTVIPLDFETEDESWGRHAREGMAKRPACYGSLEHLPGSIIYRCQRCGRVFLADELSELKGTAHRPSVFYREQ